MNEFSSVIFVSWRSLMVKQNFALRILVRPRNRMQCAVVNVDRSLVHLKILLWIDVQKSILRIWNGQISVTVIKICHIFVSPLIRCHCGQRLLPQSPLKVIISPLGTTPYLWHGFNVGRSCFDGRLRLQGLSQGWCEGGRRVSTLVDPHISHRRKGTTCLVHQKFLILVQFERRDHLLPLFVTFVVPINWGDRWKSDSTQTTLTSISSSIDHWLSSSSTCYHSTCRTVLLVVIVVAGIIIIHTQFFLLARRRRFARCRFNTSHTSKQLLFLLVLSWIISRRHFVESSRFSTR